MRGLHLSLWPCWLLVSGLASAQDGVVRSVGAPVTVRPAAVLLPPAQPDAAPPFGIQEIRPREATPETPKQQSQESTARKTKAFYDLYSGKTPPGVALQPDRCSVAIWNLTSQPLTVRTLGVDSLLAPNCSVRLGLPREFGWQVVGREAEATRIPEGHTTAEVVIRR